VVSKAGLLVILTGCYRAERDADRALCADCTLPLRAELEYPPPIGRFPHTGGLELELDISKIGKIILYLEMYGNATKQNAHFPDTLARSTILALLNS
jgi:hypothetical protein